MLREEPRVVTKAAHRPGRTPDSMLAEPGGRLGRVAGEVDARDGCALPVVRLCGQGALFDRRAAEVRKIFQRGAKARRRNGDISVDLHRARIRRPVRDDAVAAGRFVDPLDRGVEGERAATPGVVLVGLEVADPNRGQSQHVRGDGPRRDEEDLLRPRHHPVGDLKARVPFADHDDTLAFVVARLPGLDVMRDVLDTGNRHLQRVR